LILRKFRATQSVYSPNSIIHEVEKSMRMIAKLAVVPAVLVLAGPVAAAEVEVRMLNKGAEGPMVFEPSLVKITPGDSVKFIPTDKGHNAESVSGMVPEGAGAFTGKMNEELTVTFDKPGLYGVKCKPHYGMGMVGLVVVGKPENAAEAKIVIHPGRAKQKFAKLFDELGTIDTAAK
jgi:pseudoazurin